MLETESTCLLVDAGLNRKEMLRRLEAVGRRPGRVDGILISHEHTDHIAGLPQLLREWGTTAYLTEATHREVLKLVSASAAKKMKRVEHIEAGQGFAIGDIEVWPFTIPHDAADPVAYTFRSDGSKVAIVTDLGMLTHLVKQRVRECDCLILESNHDRDMLKTGSYPWHVKQRVMSRKGHLSNAKVSEFLADPEDFDGRARYLVLAHISQHNNTPELAHICAKEALDRRPAEAPFQGELMLASQHVPIGPLVV